MGGHKTISVISTVAPNLFTNDGWEVLFSNTSSVWTGCESTKKTGKEEQRRADSDLSDCCYQGRKWTSYCLYIAKSGKRLSPDRFQNSCVEKWLKPKAAFVFPAKVKELLALKLKSYRYFVNHRNDCVTAVWVPFYLLCWVVSLSSYCLYV